MQFKQKSRKEIDKMPLKEVSGLLLGVPADLEAIWYKRSDYPCNPREAHACDFDQSTTKIASKNSRWRYSDENSRKKLFHEIIP